MCQIIYAYYLGFLCFGNIGAYSNPIIANAHPKWKFMCFWEGRHWRPNGALWRKDWSIKPSGTMWKKLVSDVWWTEEKCTTDAVGVCEVSAFLGDYEIVAEHAGRQATVRTALGRPGRTETIRF